MKRKKHANYKQSILEAKDIHAYFDILDDFFAELKSINTEGDLT